VVNIVLRSHNIALSKQFFFSRERFKRLGPGLGRASSYAYLVSQGWDGAGPPPRWQCALWYYESTINISIFGSAISPSTNMLSDDLLAGAPVFQLLLTPPVRPMIRRQWIESSFRLKKQLIVGQSPRAEFCAQISFSSASLSVSNASCPGELVALFV
jgi:hypothetical protein